MTHGSFTHVEEPQREVRELESGGERWRAIEAWRGRGGHGLCYFVRLQADAIVPDDRADRRAILAPGERLGELDGERLQALLAEATALTATERRVQDPDGTPWLAQSAGPVWAEGGVAEGITGLVFTRLDGPFERRTAPAPPAAGADAGELLVHLGAARERARAEAVQASEPGEGERGVEPAQPGGGGAGDGG